MSSHRQVFWTGNNLLTKVISYKRYSEMNTNLALAVSLTLLFIAISKGQGGDLLGTKCFNGGIARNDGFGCDCSEDFGGFYCLEAKECSMAR